MGEFITEREGQLDFYNRFLPRVNPSLSIDDILAENANAFIAASFTALPETRKLLIKKQSEE